MKSFGVEKYVSMTLVMLTYFVVDELSLFRSCGLFPLRELLQRCSSVETAHLLTRLQAAAHRRSLLTAEKSTVVVSG